MKKGMTLLLCHETQGIGGQAERHGCAFDVFFKCAEGTTPQHLKDAGIYSQSDHGQGPNWNAVFSSWSLPTAHRAH